MNPQDQDSQIGDEWLIEYEWNYYGCVLWVLKYAVIIISSIWVGTKL